MSSQSREAISEKLQASAARALGGAPVVSGLQRLSGGASQQLWRFEAERNGICEQFVLRRAPPGRSGSGFSTLSLDTEAQLINVVARAAVPVPSIAWQLHAQDDLGQGYVMQALDGETRPRRILHSPELSEARTQLARQCGAVLARIHAIPTAELPDVACLSAHPQLEQLRLLYDSFKQRRPVLELAMRWLCEHAPVSAKTCLVHGDFRNGNLMVGPEGLRAVLDWELAHLGDAAEDLGWLCVNAWRFGEIDNPVGGFGPVDALLAGYADGGGATISRQQLRYWQIFGSFKWGVICLLQAFTHLGGHQNSVELATIGRRVSEAEFDLLQLLHPRRSLPPLPQADGAARIRPDIADLADAVAGFLADSAAPALSGSTGFQARVAANAASIIAREARCGAAADAAQLQRLHVLLDLPADATAQLGELNAQLCRDIRNAKLGADTPGLVDHLWATTHARMAVDQPGYTAYKRLTEQAS